MSDEKSEIYEKSHSRVQNTHEQRENTRGVTHYREERLETYSIGLENSEDIKYARIVADYIGSKHTEIIVIIKKQKYSMCSLI